MNAEKLVALACESGARNAAAMKGADVVFDRVFRAACEQNSCGMYGKCHTCPPDIGDIDVLIERAKGYDSAVLFQTISDLEDSFDFEGMQEAGKNHAVCSQKVRTALTENGPKEWLLLSSGGCRFCEKCAKADNAPCRFPDKALSSLEAYGIDVYNTARQCGLKYINGQNTVTYFGIILYNA